MLGTREIGVIHHTNCGLEGVTEEEVAERTGVRDMTFLAFPDARESVRDDVDRIAGLGQMPAEMVVWGAVYDVDSGALEVVAPPQAVGTAP
jgi:carbonic anhydrase